MKKRMTAGLAILCAALFITVAQAGVITGGTYYTRVNIWYENPEKIYSTNYHTGVILPAGSRVGILDIGENRIQFRDENGMLYTLLYNPKHNVEGLSAYLDSVFSVENILTGREYQKFSKAEKENISRGVIAEGMSKAAVLLAYGIPPSHRTRSTRLNTWTYWENRFQTTMVTFSSDGLVTSITQ